MRLLRLHVGMLPGIDPQSAFTLDGLPPGVTVITGPNGVGKSSLVRALRLLLADPAPGDPTAVSLSADFEAGGAHYTVRRSGSDRSWLRDGRAVEPPPLPGADALHAGWLSMESLLSADAGDQRLVAELRRALAGGFDLHALRAEAFEARPKVGMHEARALITAQTQLNQTESAYRALREEEEQLPQLERAIAEARAAAAAAARLDQAVGLAQARAERAAVEAGLASFADGMAKLRGDELQRLEKLDEDRAQLRADLEMARGRGVDAAARLDASGLRDGAPDAAWLDAQSERLRYAERLRDQSADRERELEQARAEASVARATLGGGDRPPALVPEAIAHAEALAETLKAGARARNELAAQIEDVGEGPSDDDIERHAQSAEALRTWLAASGARVPLLALALAGAAALVASALAVMAERWPAAGAAVLALVAVLWAGLAGPRAGAATARRRFSEAGLEAPAQWQPAVVRERLAAVDAALAQLRLQRARAEYLAEQKRRLEGMDRQLDELTREREATAAELGFDPRLTAEGIGHFARRSGDWLRAVEKCAALEGELDRLRRQSGETLTAVRDALSRWQPLDADGIEGLGAGLRALAARRRDAEAAAAAQAEAAREAERLSRELERRDREEATLLQEAGVDDAGRDALRARLQRLDEWKAQRDRHADARRREAEAAAALEGDALRERALPDGREDLIAERDAARADAQQLEALQQRRTEISTRLADAGRDGRLERALAQVDAARSALADRRDEALFAEAGRCLLDGIEAEYRSEHEPAVLRDARERFARFTHHAWDVELDDADGLVARDLLQGERRAVTELSSGTRMQLLLAVRLAWLQALERGRETLPLILDEALTTSDERRFGSVAAALQQLADDEGRQVFYLGARRQEPLLWQRLVGTAPHHVDLARVRFGRPEAAPDDYAVVLPEAVPAPDGRGAEAYAAALGVPPVAPDAPVGELHAFHLLRDDLGLLHALLDGWRVATLAQLEHLLNSSAATAAVPDRQRQATLLGRCRAARAWFGAWRQGRGRPVERTVLEASDAVSDRFIEPVAALADAVHGDARRLLEGLRNGEVKGFRGDKREQLEAWLLEHGQLDPAEPLDAAERERRTLQDAAGAASPEDTRRVIGWLESGARARASAGA